MSDNTTTDGGVRISNKGDDLLLQRTGGNVGIGTASPRVRLEVFGSSDKLYAAVDGINDLPSASVTIENGSTLSNSSANLNFYHGGSGSAISRIASLRTNTSRSELAFITQGATGRKEQMRIDSDGNVGIGTATPSAPLDISSTTGGLNIPRMTSAQRKAITSTTQSEMVFDDTDNTFYGYDGTTWKALHS